jgi:hypothetical protein
MAGPDAQEHHVAPTETVVQATSIKQAVEGQPEFGVHGRSRSHLCVLCVGVVLTM